MIILDKKECALAHSRYEPNPGLEPGTYALRMRCSTN